MKTTTYSSKVLTASEGCYITDVNVVDEDARGFYRQVILAPTDSEEDYEEWSEERCAEWRMAHEK